MSFLPQFKSRAIEAVRLQTRLMEHRLTPLYDHCDQGDRPDLLAHCTACGMRVLVDSKQRALSGEALHLTCDHDAVRLAESSAWLISQIPALMLRRFQQVLERGTQQQRDLFENGEFDPLDQSLLSRDGTWALRYETREDCLYPISEHNPQFPEGITFVESRLDKDGMRWARYIGPRLNPNGHENREQWLVLPLESGECGWFYGTILGGHRFRREHGVVGYYVNARDCVLEEKPAEEELGEVEETEPLGDPLTFNTGPEPLFPSADLPAQPLAYP